MIGIEPVESLVKYALFSGYLKDDRPLSVMLVAASGAGKSDCLLQFKENPTVFVLNDLTRYGLWEKIKLASKNKAYLTHCIIPDFTQILMQNPFYVGSICSTMMSLSEEGTDSVWTKNIRYDVPNTRLGFLTSMARDDFEVKKKDSRSILVKTGFLSRFLVLSYRYTTETAVLVARAISEGSSPEPLVLNPPLTKVDVQVNPDQVLGFFPGTNPEDLGKGLNLDWVDAVAKKSERDQVDVNLIPRKVKQYRVLLKAIALANGRREVTDEECRELHRLENWLNTRFNPI